jgi:nucleoid-associated protein YgaU
MKKFSTQVLGLALSLLVGAAADAQPLELAKDAPDRYVVVRGDTLWDISGKFLQKPWRWPEIWQLNREQIRDPHWIYPGDIVYLDNSGGTPRLRLARSVASGGSDAAGERVERAQPAVRSEPLPKSAVPTIDGFAIAPFLNRPLVVDEKGLQAHPRIIATQDGRVYLGRGELAYARGIPAGAGAEWHVYRPARPLLDPDTRRPIAWEAKFVGSARLERDGDPATLRMQSVTEEVGPGDRLMPAERSEIVNYVPSPPASPVAGRIVAVHQGVAQAGRNSVVALNVGSEQGVAVGNVLAIKERGRVVRDRDTREMVSLPGEPIGHLLVFRVFDKIAYGLIMTSSRDVSIGDDVANP